MLNPSVTMVHPLAVLGLIRPLGLAIALEDVDCLSAQEASELRQVFGPIAKGLPGVHLARGILQRDALTAWRNTAQQLKDIPRDQFEEAVARSLEKGAAWLYGLTASEKATDSLRKTYFQNRSRLEEIRLLEDPLLRLAQKGTASHMNPRQQQWNLWLRQLTLSPTAMAKEVIDQLEEKLAPFPNAGLMLSTLKNRLVLTPPYAPFPDSEIRTFTHFKQQLGFICEAYLEARRGKVQGWLKPILNMALFPVLQPELQKRRQQLRRTWGRERAVLVKTWQREFSPAMDDFVIELKSGAVLVNKLYQGNGRLETVQVEATNEEVIRALPLSHYGILRTILRVLEEAKDKTSIRFFTDEGERLFASLEKAAQHLPIDPASVYRKIVGVQKALSQAAARSDQTLKKPCKALAHLSDMYLFWVDETARLVSHEEVEPLLKKAFIHWRYYYDLLLPESVHDPMAFDRMRRGFALWSKYIRKTNSGTRLFVSHALIQLLAEEPLLSVNAFIQRLEQLPASGNYYASFYQEISVKTAETDPQKEARKKAARTERLSRRKERARATAERNAAALAQKKALQVEENKNWKAKEAKAAALAEAARKAKEAETAERKRLEREHLELTRRRSLQTVIFAQEEILLRLLSGIEDIVKEQGSPSNNIKTPDTFLTEYQEIQLKLKAAMKLPPDRENAVDDLAGEAKALVEEARTIKRKLAEA